MAGRRGRGLSGKASHVNSSDRSPELNNEQTCSKNDAVAPIDTDRARSHLDTAEESFYEKHLAIAKKWSMEDQERELERAKLERGNIQNSKGVDKVAEKKTTRNNAELKENDNENDRDIDNRSSIDSSESIEATKEMSDKTAVNLDNATATKRGKSVVEATIAIAADDNHDEVEAPVGPIFSATDIATKKKKTTMTTMTLPLRQVPPALPPLPRLKKPTTLSK